MLLALVQAPLLSLALVPLPLVVQLLLPLAPLRVPQRAPVR